MYTIQQIKNGKFSVFINSMEEYNVLKKLGFNLCKWYGAYSYGVNEGQYNGSSTREIKHYYSGYNSIDYSDINFEELYSIY